MLHFFQYRWKMSFRALYIALSICWIASSCSNDNGAPKTRIEITHNLGSGVVYLDELLVKERKSIDSVSLIAGSSAVFLLSTEEEGFYVLRDLQGRNIVLCLAPREEVQIDWNSGSDSPIVVSGSPGSELLQEYFSLKRKDEQRIDSLGQVFRDSRSLPDFPEIRNRLDSNYYAIMASHRKKVMELIIENDTSIVSLFMLNQRIGQEVLFDEQYSFELMEQLDETLFSRFPENNHVKEHHHRVSIERQNRYNQEQALSRLKAGMQAPGIQMRDIEGRDWSFDKLTDRPTLLHFWAASDGPSRKENRALRSLHKTHKEVEFVSVSMDNSPEAWRAAVTLDGFDWTNVSELLGMDSPAGQIYLPEKKLPCYCLIDRDRRIVFRVFSIAEADSLLTSIK